jgi:hypothetical protein
VTSSGVKSQTVITAQNLLADSRTINMQSPAARVNPCVESLRYYAFISTLEIPMHLQPSHLASAPTVPHASLVRMRGLLPPPTCQLLHHGSVSKSPDGRGPCVPSSWPARARDLHGHQAHPPFPSLMQGHNEPLAGAVLEAPSDKLPRRNQ